MSPMVLGPQRRQSSSGHEASQFVRRRSGDAFEVRTSHGRLASRPKNMTIRRI